MAVVTAVLVTVVLVVEVPPPSGYDQLNVAPAMPADVNVKLFPEHIGLGDADAVGAAGV